MWLGLEARGQPAVGQRRPVHVLQRPHGGGRLGQTQPRKVGLEHHRMHTRTKVFQEPHDGRAHDPPSLQAGAAGEHDYRIFSASIDNTMRLWDPYDMACIRVLEESVSEVSAMTYYEGWNIVVTGGEEDEGLAGAPLHPCWKGGRGGWTDRRLHGRQDGMQAGQGGVDTGRTKRNATTQLCDWCIYLSGPPGASTRPHANFANYPCVTAYEP